MNFALLLGLDTVSGAITGANVYMLNKHRKLAKERRDANRRTQADREDPGPGEDAGGGASVPASPLEAGEAAHPRLQTVEQLDPIRAWKSVAVKGDEHTVHLHSHHTGGRLALEAQAECHGYYSSGGGVPHGPVPRLNCSCGWYALKDRSEVTAMGSGSLVVAEVDLYGTVIEAEKGYRAEHQRILALVIPRDYCHGAFMCSERPELVNFPWVEVQQSAWSHNAPPPPVIKERHLAPVCRKHADEEAVELSLLASRLGVEVRWA